MIGCLVGSAVLLIAFVIVERTVQNPMFDLSLFRLPTFTGGAVAAFGLSASIFALLLYLVLYLQDVLGFSALGTGLRLLVLSGGILLTSTLAGRLTSHVPVRLLIGPGLLIVGLGLLLMRGIDAGTDVDASRFPASSCAGIGVGLINPPLASTAVGVVRHDRAGMASGINSTFRQVGIATGIALLGAIFAKKVNDVVLSQIKHAHGLAGEGHRIATAVKSGALQQTLAHLPPDERAKVALVAKTAFTTGLDQILLVGAIIAFVSGLVSLAAIRGKDFVQPAQQPPPPAESAG